MKSIDQKQWQEFVDKSGMVMPGKGPFIGPALSFKDPATRKMVIHFTDRDFPVGFSRKLGVLLSGQEAWYLFPRKCFFPIELYETNEISNLKHHLVQEWCKLLDDEHDLYVVGASGDVIISYGHLFMDEGLKVFIQNPELAETLLALLIDSGANAELISPTP
ncbi:MAG: hypothetical protein G3M70_08545 [Candidatus Nitronauta litoralis]|uniref:Uncharacterized protein n=1 Tax=Candidatus Nitronauta litoralis TaxID=2705533 RepID=A0A7T0BVT3_9BACT|nr:MAG: hypothetical protein G3M70_08545 [Candidatus Nitronauta litoralis]